MYDRSIAGSNLSFVGFPSVETAYHVIVPSGRVAISSNTPYAEACIDFIRVLMSEEVQSRNYLTNQFPVSQTILDRYLDYMRAPESIPEDEYTFRSLATTTYSQLDDTGHLISHEGYIEVSDEDVDNYLRFISSIDTVEAIDWGIYNIIREEISSYYSSGKSIAAIAESLSSRLSLYYQENYG